MKWLLALVMVLALASPTWATTYYVATTGSDSNNGTAVGTPFRSIQKCASVVVAGDTCTVANGTYTDTDGAGLQANGLVVYVRSTYQHGTANSPITIKSTNYLGAVIPIPTRTTVTNAAFYVDRNYWAFDGFDIGTAGGATTAANHGFYVSGTTGTVISHNKIHDIARTLCYNTANGNTGMYAPSTTNLTVTNNVFFAIGRLRNGESSCSTTIYQHDHGIYYNGGSGAVIKHNIFYDINRGWPIHLYSAAVTNFTFTNNTIDGHCTAALCPSMGQVLLGSSITTAVFKNNIFNSPTTAAFRIFSGTYSGVTVTKNVSDVADADMLESAPAGITSSSNFVSTTAGFVSVGTNDYRLAAGSASIDAGAVLSDAYNGTAPDIGAFETFTGSPTCVVENATPSKLSITFTNNLYPPVLPASPAFGTNKFTARKATVDDPVTAATRVGTNQVDLTLTNAIVGGNAVDFSYSTTSGDLTDSAIIGGTLNQRLNAITNQSCTNNVGAGATYVITQSAFAWHGLRGTEAAPINTPYVTAPESINIYTIPSGYARLRISLKCTVADCPPLGYIPYYSRNAGSYTLIPDTYGADGIAFCGTSPDTDIPTSGTPTTNQLSTTGTFVAGALIRTSNAIPTITMPTGQKTENEYCLAFNSTVVSGDTYDIRVRKQDGSVIDTYTVTPRVTIQPTASGSGF